MPENPKGNQCGNIINYFELITLGNISLNLQMFLYRQSRGTCEPMGKVRQNILEILSGSDDETLNNLINSEMTILSIYQKEGMKLYVKKQKDSFIDVLNLEY